MILTEAYDYIDLLLDKADQPYFITEEKNKFLDLAISDFINFHYQKMGTDEDSRRALAGCINWNSFELTGSEIISGNYIYNNNYPAFSLKYDDTSSSDIVGYFLFGHQYVLPKQHLYVLSIAVNYYDRDDTIDLTTGLPYPWREDEKYFSDSWGPDAVSVKNKSTRDYYEHAYTNDPFNKQSEDAPYWSYIENRLIITGANSIRYMNMQTLTLPTVEQAFNAGTYEESTTPISLTFAEHYQKQIIQIAVEKMTKVDVGLMTPPS